MSDKAQEAVQKILRSPDIPVVEAGSILMAELVNYTVTVPPEHRLGYAQRLAQFFLDQVRETLG
jgi:hypothetical protein